MKATLFFILSCVILFSCTENKETKNSELDAVVDVEKPAKSYKIKGEDDNTKGEQRLPEGNFVSNYPNGIKKVEGQVLNGKRTGVWTAYHPNGIKQSENTYINGVLNGKTVVYHANGQIMYIGYYKNGKYEGNWIYFTKEGEELKSLSFKNGIQL